jgi:hypothetical protein
MHKSNTGSARPRHTMTSNNEGTKSANRIRAGKAAIVAHSKKVLKRSGFSGAAATNQGSKKHSGLR